MTLSSVGTFSLCPHRAGAQCLVPRCVGGKTVVGFSSEAQSLEVKWVGPRAQGPHLPAKAMEAKGVLKQ